VLVDGAYGGDSVVCCLVEEVLIVVDCDSNKPPGFLLDDDGLRLWLVALVVAGGLLVVDALGGWL